MAEWRSAQCGCGCRPVEATDPGCPCAECQPGEGLSYGHRHNVQVSDRLRMRVLLQRRLLTPDEEAELDGLLAAYIHS